MTKEKKYYDDGSHSLRNWKNETVSPDLKLSSKLLQELSWFLEIHRRRYLRGFEIFGRTGLNLHTPSFEQPLCRFYGPFKGYRRIKESDCTRSYRNREDEQWSSETAEKGYITSDGLKEIRSYFEGERRILLNIIVQSYLLLKFREDLFAILVLQPEKKADSQVLGEVDHRDITVSLRSALPDSLPPGLPGRLIAYIHRVIRGEDTNPEMAFSHSIHISTEQDSWTDIIFDV